MRADLALFAVVECAGNTGRGRRRGAPAIVSDRQADQCRVPKRSFDAAGQYHDSRTANCRSACCAASTAGGGECADTGAAAGPGTDRRQKADGAEITPGCAGPAVASSRGAGSRRD